MFNVMNAAIAGASAGAFLGLGWLGAASFALLNAGLAAKRAAGVKVRPSAIAELRERIAAERNDGVQGGSGVERMEQALRDQETHFEQVYASGVMASHTDQGEKA